MSKHCALLLSVALLLVSTGRAETVVVRADWEKTRAMLTRGKFRPRSGVELKSSQRVMLTPDRGEFQPRKRTEVELKPSKWVKGELIEATGAGLQIVFREHEISIAREDIRRIRLVPRKTNRRIGLWVGIPAGIVAGFTAAKAICSAGGGCTNAGALTLLIGTPMAVIYVFHKLGGAGRPQGRAG